MCENNFFTHLSASDHLSCVHVLAIINATTMDMHVQMWGFFFELVFSFPLAIFLAVELLGHTVILFLCFFFCGGADPVYHSIPEFCTVS